jgi:HlyD family secretion protein
MKKLLILPVLAAAVISYSLIWPEPPISVELVKVEKGAVEQIAANSRSGTITPCRQSNLSLAIGGIIDSINISEGDIVKKDQILLILNNDVQTAQIELSKGEYQAAKIEEERACELADLAKREFVRGLTLKEKGLISNERFDQLESDSTSSGHICEYHRSLSRISADKINLLTIELNQRTLKAPFTGFVSKINGEVGEYLTPSPQGIMTPPAVELLDTSCLYVTAPIDEVEASKLKIGQYARITLDAFRGEIFEGVISKLGSRISDNEKQARTLEVEAAFINPEEDMQILVGYSADIEVVTSSTGNVLRVPTESVIGGSELVIFNETTNELEIRPIKIGAYNWTWSEVTEGIDLNDRFLKSTNNIDNLLNRRVVPQ